MISEQIKMIVKNYYQNMDRTQLEKGIVLSTMPFSVKIHDLVLTENFLIIPNKFMKETYQAKTIIDYPKIQGDQLINEKKEIVLTFKNEDFLKVNDEVILLKNENGQSFYIMDKVYKGDNQA